MLKADEPTLTMNFCVNTSPASQAAKASSLPVASCGSAAERAAASTWPCAFNETGRRRHFEVTGRGELHRTILLENMRREGYEIATWAPACCSKSMAKCEPIEMVTVDIEENHQGAWMASGERKELVNMEPDGRGGVRLEYRILHGSGIGFTNEFLNLLRAVRAPSAHFRQP